MQTRLMHVRANVRNLQQAIEWYSKTLGFTVRSTWPPDHPNYADFVSKEGAMFSVMEAEPVPSGGRFNFDVKDVDALWERLKDSCPIKMAKHAMAQGLSEEPPFLWWVP